MHFVVKKREVLEMFTYVFRMLHNNSEGKHLNYVKIHCDDTSICDEPTYYKLLLYQLA